MDAVFDQQPSTEILPGDLRSARNRIAELEAELSQLRAKPPLPPAISFGHMRLLEAEAWLVKHAMERAQGNISRAARALGLSRAALYRRLERHALPRASSARADRYPGVSETRS
jgi:transcriptional regulator of acetoin/glycerol metabolism